MSKPRIFVSSTYYDLRYIRSSLEQFIKSLGYEPILSEKGNIAFMPDIPLDESCYREASMSEIFILIIGGRYGSPTSSNNEKLTNNFYERYDSITKMEYESAVNRDIPTYILIEKPVYAEYETYKKNKTRENIDYAHVDSVNIFHLIENILNQPRNNPVHQFDKHQDIEIWLREQWAGLFRELISQRSGKTQLASLSRQVEELANINTTLKRYMEEIVSRVSKGEAVGIIKAEEERLAKSKIIKEFEQCSVIKNMIRFDYITLEDALKLFKKVESLEDFANLYSKLDNNANVSSRKLIEIWKKNSHTVERINEPRKALGLPDLEFKEKKLSPNL